MSKERTTAAVENRPSSPVARPKDWSKPSRPRRHSVRDTFRPEEKIINQDEKNRAINGQKGKVQPAVSQPKTRSRARRLRVPRSQDAQVAGVHDVECLDITQNTWVQSPDNAFEEIVTLTSERSSLEAASTEFSLRWIHLQRKTRSMNFKDFENVLYKTHGLYDYEVAVASKCIEEAKMMRRSFGRGRYFGPTVHQASDVVRGSAVEKVPVRATFLSIPVFALLDGNHADAAEPLLDREHEAAYSYRQSIQSFLRHVSSPLGDNGVTELPYLNSRSLRTSDEHPVRSLLQYSNIVANDDERDHQQVITRLGQDRAEKKPYIHVPEFWALTINMYTVITCAPFSVEDLCGKSVKLKAAPKKDQRILVKFTNLQGRLNDFRCRTWFGLLRNISGHEPEVDDIKYSLNDMGSHFKLIDLKFRIIDKARWNEIIDAEAAKSRLINIRLVKVDDDSHLTLTFAERKLQACVRATFILLGFTAVREGLLLQQKRLRLHNHEQKEVEQLDSRVNVIIATIEKVKRSRNFNRFLLYAARCHILDPRKTVPEKQRLDGNHGIFQQGSEKQLFPVSPARIVYGVVEPRTTASNTSRVSAIKMQTPSVIDRTTALNIPHIIINDGEPTSPDEAVSPDNASPFVPTRIPQITVDDGEAIGPVRATIDRSFESSAARLFTPAIRITRAHTFGSVSQDDIEAQHYKFPGPTDHPFSHISNDDHMVSEAVATSFRVAQQQRPHYAPLRRHSVAGLYDASNSEVLAASPQRLPFRSEGDSAILVPSKGISAAESENERLDKESLPRWDTDASRLFGASIPSAGGNGQGMHSISARAARKKGERPEDLQPFFEWHTHTVSAQDDQTKMTNGRQAEPRGIVHTALSTSGQALPDSIPDLALASVMDVLSNIDDLLSDGDFGKHTNSPALPIKSQQYHEIKLKSEDDVVAALQTESDDMLPSENPEHHGFENRKRAREFLEVKIQFYLGVLGLLGCFVHHEHRQEAKTVGKIWGIVHRICSITIKEPKELVYPLKNETKFIGFASKELEKFERQCKVLLADLRPEVSEHETAVRRDLPHSLLASFRNIVLFLLCALLAVTEISIDSEAINIARDKVNHALRDSESAFLRLTGNAGTDFDQIGSESIRTADTILGLLIENVFDISCREQTEDIKAMRSPDFDIEYVYSRYTSQCITRAKRAASARLYEDILLLKEEIDAINLVLIDQQLLFHEVLKTRESPLQNLDKRLNYRVKSNLAEMIRHFKTLRDYADQAEHWTRNSIAVRGETNKKTIFVFTAVTVIFLPLSFVSGVLGMNTVDMRSMPEGQWLFWAVALPFTFIVLVICLCIVRYKFRLRHRLRSLLSCFRTRQAHGAVTRFKSNES